MVAPQEINLQNKDDVIRLLSIVRKSGLDPIHKDEIRDLVFSLVQTPDKDTLEKLKAAIVAIGVQIKPDFFAEGAVKVQLKIDKAEPKNEGKNNIGKPRPKPVFGAVATSSPMASKTHTKDSVVSVEEVNGTVQTGVEKVEPVTPPKPPAPTIPRDTTHDKEESVISKEDAVARIKEIKRLVNDAVGNPVNLIEVNKEVGREYMKALLTAMKAASGGQGLNKAMKDLEVVFGKVQSLVEVEVVHPEPTPMTESRKENREAQPESVAISANESKEKEAGPPVREPEVIEEVGVDPMPETKTDSVTGETAQAHSPKAEVESEIEEIYPPVTTTEQVGLEVQSQAKDIEKEAVRPEPALQEELSASTEKANSSVVEPAPTKLPRIHSVAEDAKVREVEEKREETKAAKEEKPPSDPLHSEEVEAGLRQLLSEWNIFKSSGIFGTGPSGIDHPLFVELRNLHMNVVLAGRFEGVTPYVKQSIHDYMNGWRYEQGMTHDMQETFEHYLRRVIKTIIDKQKKAEVKE